MWPCLLDPLTSWACLMRLVTVLPPRPHTYTVPLESPVMRSPLSVCSRLVTYSPRRYFCEFSTSIMEIIINPEIKATVSGIFTTMVWQCWSWQWTVTNSNFTGCMLYFLTVKQPTLKEQFCLRCISTKLIFIMKMYISIQCSENVHFDLMYKLQQVNGKQQISLDSH